MKRKCYLLAPILSVVVLMVFPSVVLGFSDVSITHKYAAAIEDLSERGIINGLR